VAGAPFRFGLAVYSADRFAFRAAAFGESLEESGKPGEPLAADADAGTTLTAGDSAALSTATSPAFASAASGSAGKARITPLKALRASGNFFSEVRMRPSKTRASGL